MYFYCYLFAGINIHYRGWSNGKYGYITMVNKNFVYRFVELFEDDNGHAYSKHVDDNIFNHELRYYEEINR